MQNFTTQKRLTPIEKKRREFQTKPAIFWVQNLIVAKNLNFLVLNSMIFFKKKLLKFKRILRN
jgi:hypothetical protein